MPGHPPSELLDAATLAWTDAAAAAARGGGAIDLLGLTAAMRTAHPAAEPAAVSAALTQAGLRHRALERMGKDALTLLWTHAGLEQATRPQVAARRARLLVNRGVTHVVDLGAGLGLETLAFAAAGMEVDAVEADPETAELLEANVSARGFADRVRVYVEDMTPADALWRHNVTPATALFVDPARRSAGRRLARPDQWSPPWDWVAALGREHDRLVAKVAPGIPHDLVPQGGHAEWTSVDGQLVEAAVWWPGLINRAGRSATVIRGTTAAAIDNRAPEHSDIAPVGKWLVEPDDAVIRAGLVAHLAHRAKGHLLDRNIAYITCDTMPSGALQLAKAWEVLEVHPFNVKTLRRRLATLSIDRIVVKKRAFAASPDDILKTLRVREGDEASPVLFVTRLGLAPTAILCGPRTR